MSGGSACGAAAHLEGGKLIRLVEGECATNTQQDVCVGRLSRETSPRHNWKQEKYV